MTSAPGVFISYSYDSAEHLDRVLARGRGTRQRVYVLGSLGDLERQKRNYSAAMEYFERAIELGRSTFIPGWLGNLHLGLAEIAIDQSSFDQAKVLLDQAESALKIDDESKEYRCVPLSSAVHLPLAESQKRRLEDVKQYQSEQETFLR